MTLSRESCSGVGEEGHELRRGMARGRLTQHFAGLGVEGGVQRQRAVSEIFEAMALGPPWRQRQYGVLAIQCLNRRLLIDAEHGRVLGRVEVQANDVGGLGLEVWIVGGQITFESMWLDAMFGPDACHRHVRDATTQLGSQLARGPMGGAVGGLVLGRARQHTGFELIRHLVALAS